MAASSTSSSTGSRGVYLCHICEKPFNTKKECMEHTKSHYQPAQESAPQDNMESNLPTSTTVDNESTASETDQSHIVPSLKKFSDEEILAKLLERNYAYVCKCGIIFREQSLFFLHRGTHSSRNPYECTFCGHVAPDWNDFMSHFFVHSAPKDK